MGVCIDKSEVERRIVLPGEGSVTVRSADDPDALRGAGLDGVVLDEAASMKEEAWKEAIRPALADKQGWATFIGTPKGFNWFHDLFERAGQGGDWARWQRPSWDNPLVTPEELKSVRMEIGAFAYSQEIEADFTSVAGGCFPREMIPEPLPGFPREARLLRYWDKAGTAGAGDYSAGVLMGVFDGIFYVIDVLRGQWSSSERNRVIRQAAAIDNHSYGYVSVWTEQEPGSGGKESAEITLQELAGYDVHAERVTGKKWDRAQPFAAQWQAGNVRLLRGAWNQAYLDELAMFRGDDEGQDDQVDASSGAFNKLCLAPPPVEEQVEYLNV